MHRTLHDIELAARRAIDWKPDWLGAWGANDDHALEPAEVKTALLWIAAGPVQITSTPTAGCSSYTFKHDAERWGRLVGLEPYVSNGALICAAVYLGIPHRRSKTGPNVRLGLKIQDRKRELVGTLERFHAVAPPAVGRIGQSYHIAYGDAV